MMLSFWGSLALGTYLLVNGHSLPAYILLALSALIAAIGLKAWWIDD